MCGVRRLFSGWSHLLFLPLFSIPRLRSHDLDAGHIPHSAGSPPPSQRPFVSFVLYHDFMQPFLSSTTRVELRLADTYNIIITCIAIRQLVYVVRVSYSYFLKRIVRNMAMVLLEPRAWPSVYWSRMFCFGGRGAGAHTTPLTMWLQMGKLDDKRWRLYSNGNSLSDWKNT